MNKAEKLLDKHAKRTMLVWHYPGFKKRFRRLNDAIIAAINEALLTEPKKEETNTPN